MSRITIRHCEARDIEQIRAIYADPTAFANTLQLPFPSIEVSEKRLSPCPDGFTCLVAVRDDEVLGQLGLEVFCSPRRRHAATLGMGVKTSARRIGVGSALLCAAIDLCEKWMNVLKLRSTPTMTRLSLSMRTMALSLRARVVSSHFATASASMFTSWHA